MIDILLFIAGRNERVKTRFFISIFIRNGGSSCSIFCMCVMLLDQLKNEHAVDIFQRVRALQRQRVAMITSLVRHKSSIVCLFEISFLYRLNTNIFMK
jgi:hypothetical protein